MSTNTGGVNTIDCYRIQRNNRSEFTNSMILSLTEKQVEEIKRARSLEVILFDESTGLRDSAVFYPEQLTPRLELKWGEVEERVDRIFTNLRMEKSVTGNHGAQIIWAVLVPVSLRLEIYISDLSISTGGLPKQ